MSLSEETKKKISGSRKGQRLSLETRRKLSEAKKGLKLNHQGEFKKGSVPWNKKNSKKIKRRQIRHNGKVIDYAHYIYLRYYNLDSIPEGFVIHHVDENPLNNDITNLRMMRKEDHSFLHQMLDKKDYTFRNKVKELKDRIHNILSDYRGSKELILLEIDEIFGEELVYSPKRQDNSNANVDKPASEDIKESEE